MKFFLQINKNDEVVNQDIYPLLDFKIPTTFENRIDDVKCCSVIIETSDSIIFGYQDEACLIFLSKNEPSEYKKLFLSRQYATNICQITEQKILVFTSKKNFLIIDIIKKAIIGEKLIDEDGKNIYKVYFDKVNKKIVTTSKLKISVYDMFSFELEYSKLVMFDICSVCFISKHK